MSKNVAVLFSGGLDSTYLVWKNLSEGNHVIPIYIEIENNEMKSILEKNRIELLREEFLKEFSSRMSYIRYVFKASISANESGLYFKQIPIWILGIIYSQSLPVDEIQIGYVMNDDAISYLDDIQNIYKSYQPICDTLTPLVFPLTKKSKWQMADELPKQYLNLIVSCENPRIIGSKDARIVQYEPCCECVPCSHIIESQYYHTYRFPDNYKDNLLRKHVKALRNNGYEVVDEDGNKYRHKYDLLYQNEPFQLYINFDFTLDNEYQVDKARNQMKEASGTKDFKNNSKD
jgi:7-cyano-7-deazaguanine synthase in queuosine biosynthesis